MVASRGAATAPEWRQTSAGRRSQDCPIGACVGMKLLGSFRTDPGGALHLWRRAPPAGPRHSTRVAVRASQEGMERACATGCLRRVAVSYARGTMIRVANLATCGNLCITATTAARAPTAWMAQPWNSLLAPPDTMQVLARPPQVAHLFRSNRCRSMQVGKAGRRSEGVSRNAVLARRKGELATMRQPGCGTTKQRRHRATAQRDCTARQPLSYGPAALD